MLSTSGSIFDDEKFSRFSSDLAAMEGINEKLSFSSSFLQNLTPLEIADLIYRTSLEKIDNPETIRDRFNPFGFFKVFLVGNPAAEANLALNIHDSVYKPSEATWETKEFPHDHGKEAFVVRNLNRHSSMKHSFYLIHESKPADREAEPFCELVFSRGEDHRPFLVSEESYRKVWLVKADPEVNPNGVRDGQVHSVQRTSSDIAFSLTLFFPIDSRALGHRYVPQGTDVEEALSTMAHRDFATSSQIADATIRVLTQLSETDGQVERYFSCPLDELYIRRSVE